MPESSDIPGDGDRAGRGEGGPKSGSVSRPSQAWGVVLVNLATMAWATNAVLGMKML